MYNILHILNIRFFFFTNTRPFLLSLASCDHFFILHARYLPCMQRRKVLFKNMSEPSKVYEKSIWGRITCSCYVGKRRVVYDEGNAAVTYSTSACCLHRCHGKCE